jgi:hypothetical protein
MVRAGLGILILVLFTACSGKTVDYKSPYCYTDQTIVLKDGADVSSETILECSDRPGKQAEIQRAGIDKACREFEYTEVRYGKRYLQRGVQCEYPDGSVEVLDLNGLVR